MTHEEARKRHEEIRAYYRKGHTQKETADAFGTTKDYVRKLCRGIRPGNQYTNGLFDREANAKKHVEKIAGYEYAGNFTGVDGFVDIRCKKCGHIQRKSMVSIRHGSQPFCPVCISNAKEKKRVEAAKAREKERERKKQERYLSQKFTQISFVVCGCCGNVFVTANSRRKYCSKECLAKVTNSVTKDKRIKKMRAVVVDRGISLERLYQRDEGKCYICGRTCDWNDYYINKNGAFIAGQNYPSIDHVTPLSKGGKHEWLNVKLACRKCNWEKSDSMSSLYA